MLMSAISPPTDDWRVSTTQQVPHQACKAVHHCKGHSSVYHPGHPLYLSHFRVLGVNTELCKFSLSLSPPLWCVLGEVLSGAVSSTQQPFELRICESRIAQSLVDFVLDTYYKYIHHQRNHLAEERWRYLHNLGTWPLRVQLIQFTGSGIRYSTRHASNN